MTQYLPLEGVRICDFTAVWAGQTATMYLADLGAECIKVENPYIWNPMTRAASPRIDANTAKLIPAWMGGHPNSDPGPRPWNNSPAFIHVLRNKKSFTVDSRRPEGLEVVKSLIRISNVIAQNLALGTLDKLGLSDDAIRALRPDIIIAHMPGFGLTGDYVEGRGYGSHIDGVGGGTLLRGYRDASPDDNTQIFASDFTAGLHGAVAMLAALRHQRRTGEGQTIEISQMDAAAQMFPQSLLDAAWNGRAHASIGNRSIEGFVPNGVFPAAGTNNWVAISCRSDAEWAALVEYMGRPSWAVGESFATATGRAEREDEIEELLAEFTSTRDQMSLFHELQAAGVTAGPVLNSGQAADDPHLSNARSYATLPATPDYPETKFPGPAAHFSKSNVSLRTPPAAFAEHNDYVYREVLGMSDAEIARLAEQGHIRDRFDDTVIKGA